MTSCHFERFDKFRQSEQTNIMKISAYAQNDKYWIPSYLGLHPF